MPEQPSSGGKGLKKRVGPLSVGGWAASVGGALVLFILYKRYEADKANAAAAGGGTGAGVLTAGGTIPGSSGTTTATAGAPFSSYAQWLTAAIAAVSSGGNVDAGQALDGITTWLGGGCVSQNVYNAITQQVLSNTSIGLPPGWGTNIPTLSVCAAAATPAPTPTPTPTPAPAPAPAPAGPPAFAGLSTQLYTQMTNNGEHLADAQWDPVYNEWIVLTDMGGIYNVNAQGNPSGGKFFGSYLGLPAQDTQGGPRRFNKLTINPDGTYTITATSGETYHFDQTIASLEGV